MKRITILNCCVSCNLVVDTKQYPLMTVASQWLVWHDHSAIIVLSYRVVSYNSWNFHDCTNQRIQGRTMTWLCHYLVWKNLKNFEKIDRFIVQVVLVHFPSLFSSVFSPYDPIFFPSFWIELQSIFIGSLIKENLGRTDTVVYFK